MEGQNGLDRDREALSCLPFRWSPVDLVTEALRHGCSEERSRTHFGGLFLSLFTSKGRHTQCIPSKRWGAVCCWPVYSQLGVAALFGRAGTSATIWAHREKGSVLEERHPDIGGGGRDTAALVEH